MGIRFYCPNGHKLNVKAFQAGRQGVCPVCGVTMSIPLKSTRSSSKQRALELPPFGSEEGVPPPALPAAGPPIADPLAEAGDVVWYVRPALGEQLGPAGPNVMRTWLAQGRIAADALVWREGWRDWRPAGGVFPQFSPGYAAAELESVVAEPIVTPLYPHPSKHHAPPRRMQLIVLGTLVLIVLVLSVILLLLEHARNQ